MAKIRFNQFDSALYYFLEDFKLQVVDDGFGKYEYSLRRALRNSSLALPWDRVPSQTVIQQTEK